MKKSSTKANFGDSAQFAEVPGSHNFDKKSRFAVFDKTAASHENDSSVASLGTTANSVAALPKQAQKATNWQLLSTAQTLLDNAKLKNTVESGVHRTRLCYACRAYQADSIGIRLSTSAEDSFASFSGLQTCACVWACPVCSSRIAVKRGQEIGRAIQWAEDTKHTPVMMTLTASHHHNGLEWFKDRFKSAYRALLQSRQYRKLRRKMGVKYLIKAVEVTRTYENGWHYHYHILLFVPNKILMQADFDLKQWQAEATEVWLHELNKVGLSGSHERALDVRTHRNIKAEYLSKLGLTHDDTTDARHELSGNKNKAGRHIWSILRKAREGDENDANSYVEYVTAMTGEKWITWTPKFKELVGLVESTDDAAAGDESNEPSELWMELTDKEFKPVRVFRAQHLVLGVAAETRSKVAVREVLDKLAFDYGELVKKRIDELLSLYYRALDDFDYELLRLRGKYPGTHKNSRGWDESDIWLDGRSKKLLKCFERMKRHKHMLIRLGYQFDKSGVQ